MKMRLQRHMTAVGAAIAAALLAWPGPSWADTKYPQLPDMYPYLVPLNEAESVAMTDLTAVAVNASMPWVVLRVRADNLSGRAIYSAETSNTICAVSGTYTVVGQLGQPVVGLSGKYGWPCERRIMSHDGRIRRFWDDSFGAELHESGNIVLCEDAETSSGPEQFTQAVSAPVGWEKYVAPAVFFLRRRAEMPIGSPSSLQAADWKGLLTSPNPYLRATAVQQLSAHDKVTTADVDRILGWPESCAIAAGLCAVCRCGWFNSAANSVFVCRKVEKINRLDPLLAVADGFAAAGKVVWLTFDDTKSFIPLAPKANLDHVGAIMASIRTRLNVLDPNGGSADLTWCAIDYACRMYGK